MEELQALWRNASVSEEHPVSPQELDAMVNHRSLDELQKFRQVIMAEYISTWLVVPLLIVVPFWLPEYLVATIFIAAMSGYLLYFYHRALKQFDKIHFEDDLQTYLRRALIFLKTYVRHYKIVVWVGIVVAFAAGYFMPDEDVDPIFRSTTKSILEPTSSVYLIGTIVFVVVCLLLLHFYIKYLYQARINNLEKLLSEFSEG